MKVAHRLKYLGLVRKRAAALAFVVAGLISACVPGPDGVDGVARGDSRTLSYFVASPVEDPASSKVIATTFRTLSGATVDVWREPEPRRGIAFDEIRALRIREGRPSPFVARPAPYVMVEVEVDGAQADALQSLLEERGEKYLWVTLGEDKDKDKGEDKAIDFLPIIHAIRPVGEKPLRRVWISAGTFQNRQQAERLFGDLGEIPRTFVALSEAERAVAWAENARLVDYAIWESVCDSSALAEVGGRLAQHLSALPDYTERAREVDCRFRPELGGDPASAEGPAGGGAKE